MTDDQVRAVDRCRELADEARAAVKTLDELYRNRGWLTDAEKLERARLEGRAAGLDAAADIVAGVVV